MATKLQFFSVHEHSVLIIGAAQHDAPSLNVKGEYISLLAETPIVATYAPLIDIRDFVGVIALNDLAGMTAAFRQTRISLGRDMYLHMPQSILCKTSPTSISLAEMIKVAQAFPDLIKVTDDYKKAWSHVSGDATMPEVVDRFLRPRSLWKRLFS